MFSLTHPQCPYPIVRTSRPPGDDRRFLKYLTAGNYLKLIPTCPASGRDTYSESYQVQAAPDTFSFYCSGKNHGDLVLAGYPQYNAEMGLIDRP